MITIGEIVAPYGLRGELRVQPHTDFPDRFATLEQVWISSTEGAPRQYRLRSARLHAARGQVVLSLTGVDGRVAAEQLRGALVQIPDEQAVELPADTYFEHDILGLEVVTTEGEALGKITDILHTGANDVYVTPRCLIPAIEAVVQEVDLEAGRMLIVAIPGLLDDDAD